MVAKIVEVNTSKEIVCLLKDLGKGAVIFCDIDDTIIVPNSKSFHTSKSGHLIDEIKQNKKQYKNYETIISNWRLQRKVMLVDSFWSDTINLLKKYHTVYGLTKMDPGNIGNIPSIEKWRFDELKSLGVMFSPNDQLNNFIPASYKSEDEPKPVFFNGIFFTGSYSKGEVVDLYKTILKPNYIVMIDDRINHLKDVQNFCLRESINYLGVCYNGVSLLPFQKDLRITNFQRQYLIKNAQWLEDDEALKLINQGISVK